MPVCEKHGTYLKGNEVCGYCYREGYKVEKQKKKPSQLKKKAAQAQALLSKLVKLIHCKGSAFTNCWTCNKRIMVKGSDLSSTAHCGHYYPKSKYWKLAFRIENVGIQCYDCNVWNQGTIPAMRPKLVAYFGEDKIKQLETDADDFMNQLNIGAIKSKPDEFYLMAQIEHLKYQIKKIN